MDSYTQGQNFIVAKLISIGFHPFQVCHILLTLFKHKGLASIYEKEFLGAFELAK